MMKNHGKNTRKLNFLLTRRVIELHGQGYDHDFLVSAGRHLICLQNNMNFNVEDVNIEVVDQGYDQLSRSFKYVHTIDTGNGERGVLIAEGILTNSTFAY
jgi:hypothetical protein